MSIGKTVTGVQYLRAIAAIFVVIEHGAKMSALPQYLKVMPADIYGYGHFGVSIFFVISGFIIAAVSLDERMTPKIRFIEFMRRRATRIIPFLWVCIIIYFVLRVIGTQQLDVEPTLRALVIWPIGELRPNVVWTLRHEFLFYEVFALAFLLNAKFKSILYIWFASPAIKYILTLLFPSILTANYPVLFELANLIFSWNNLFFASGFFLGKLYISDVDLPYVKGGIFSTICFSIFGLVLVQRFQDNIFVNLVIATGLVLLSLNMTQREGPTSRAGHLLGDASYAIYLTHNLAFLILLPIAVRLGSGRFPLASHFVMTVLAITLGVVTHFLLEKPIVKFASGIGKARRAT